LATDKSPEWMAWRHAIDYVRDNFGVFDTFVSLPATSPLRSVSDVELAIKTLQKSDADICISVTPASRNPYFNMIKLHENNIAELVIKPADEVSRRQEAPKVYDITTVAYVAKLPFIEKNTSIFKGKVIATVIPKNRAIDIDDIYDFKFAETVLKSELTDA
jgi:N-acylneuraminate cytidylyltransferase